MLLSTGIAGIKLESIIEVFWGIQVVSWVGLKGFNFYKGFQKVYLHGIWIDFFIDELFNV